MTRATAADTVSPAERNGPGSGATRSRSHATGHEADDGATSSGSTIATPPRTLSGKTRRVGDGLLGRRVVPRERDTGTSTWPRPRA